MSRTPSRLSVDIEPIYSIGGVELYSGDSRSILREIPSGVVSCCVTSPPYWGQRDYGTGTWIGGSDSCDHRRGEIRTHKGLAEAANCSDGGKRRSEDRKDSDALGLPYLRICEKCGARRVDLQIGLEPSPAEYVSELVSVFREVRRVLRDDGTLWINIGDCYAGSGKGGQSAEKRSENWKPSYEFHGVTPTGLKPKDLVGAPWLLAFALREDGWWLRQEIIWAKPNPLPEPVRDRCTKAHETIFLFAKSSRYYYDSKAIAEPTNQPVGTPKLTGQHKADAEGFTNNGTGNSSLGSNQGREERNRRSVWFVSPKPYSGAHFAVMPEKIAELCILAGSPVGGLVLDPFVGAGTVPLVARKFGRKAIGIDLNENYCRIAAERLSQGVLSLFEDRIEEAI